jgi:hypothetical protein
MYSTVNRIFHFSCFDPNYPTSRLTVTGLARVYYTIKEQISFLENLDDVITDDWCVKPKPKPKPKYRVLIQEKLDIIRSQLKHLLYKPLKHLAQEMGTAKKTARTTTKSLELWP